MTCQQEQYERVCRQQFAQIHVKLDRLDEAIRGNGRPGLRQRLERLEEAAESRGRLMWLVLGAFASAGASVVMQVLQMLGRF